MRSLADILDLSDTAPTREELLGELQALRMLLPGPAEDATSFYQRQNMYQAIGAYMMRGRRLSVLIDEIERLSAYSMHERSLGADAGAIARFDAGWNAALGEAEAIARSEDRCDCCNSTEHVALAIRGLIATDAGAS
jgi:hypothetical protein